MWDEYNYAVVWTFSGIALLWDLNENWPFPVLWPLLSRHRETAGLGRPRASTRAPGAAWSWGSAPRSAGRPFFYNSSFSKDSHCSSRVTEHWTCRSWYGSLPQTHSDAWVPAARIQTPRLSAVSGPQRRAQKLCLPGSRDPACEKPASSHAGKSTHQSHTHSDWAVWSAYLITPELEKNVPNWITKNWKLSNFSWKWAPSTTPSTHTDHLVLKLSNPHL